MISNYSYGIVPMKPETEKVELIYEDICAFNVPKILFEGSSETHEENSEFDWNTNSILVIDKKNVVKYTESIFYEILMTDHNGRSDWIDSGLADVLGIDIQGYEDIRVAKKYRIEKFDLEKLEKSTYKVVLEETSSMDNNEYDTITKLLNKEK
jgi:hypothetical protein